jgi:predicted  nucleic acid-binding Zn-ribbon protein
MKKIALALLMGLSLFCVGCGRSHDAREARDKTPKFNSDTNQARREVIEKEKEVANDRDAAEKVQADIDRATEKARVDVEKIKVDTKKVEAEAVKDGPVRIFVSGA